MADPPTAYASLVRRDNSRRITRHMHGGQYGQCTIEGMETFFEDWTRARPLVCVMYKALYDHLPDIAAALGVHFRRFPPHRPRKLHPAPDHIRLHPQIRVRALTASNEDMQWYFSFLWLAVLGAADGSC